MKRWRHRYGEEGQGEKDEGENLGSGSFFKIRSEQRTQRPDYELLILLLFSFCANFALLSEAGGLE